MTSSIGAVFQTFLPQMTRPMAICTIFGWLSGSPAGQMRPTVDD
jgi:hypothetical protein